MERELGNFESALTLSDDNAPLNAVAVARLESTSAGSESLRRALGELARRQPLLGVRITGRGGRYAFTSEDARGPALHLRPRADDESWHEAAETELARRIDRERGPLLYATLLAEPGESRRELILTFHHAIMDAGSALHLLGELLELWSQVETGLEPDERPVLDPLPASDRLFPAGFRRGRAVAHYLAGQLGGELGARLRGRYRQPRRRDASACRIVTATLPAAATRALTRRTRRERVTLASALAAAQLVELARREGKPVSLPHLFFTGLRPYLEPPVTEENLGAYFAMLRLVTKVDPGEDLWANGRRLQAQLERVFARGAKFAAALTAAPMMKFLIRHEPFRMGSAALSHTGPAKLESRYGPIELRGLHAFVANFHLGPEIAAQARLFGGELIWDALYLEADMNAEGARELIHGVLTSLEVACRKNG